MMMFAGANSMEFVEPWQTTRLLDEKIFANLGTSIRYEAKLVELWMD